TKLGNTLRGRPFCSKRIRRSNPILRLSPRNRIGWTAIQPARSLWRHTLDKDCCMRLATGRTTRYPDQPHNLRVDTESATCSGLSPFGSSALRRSEAVATVKNTWTMAAASDHRHILSRQPMDGYLNLSFRTAPACPASAARP